MGWIASLARVIGTAIPFGGAAVQISAELEGREIQRRLKQIEDPLSALHPDVRAVSQLLYERLATADGSKVELSPQEHDQYARSLAMLEANGLLDGTRAIGTHYAIDYWFNSPAYVLYMAALYEDADLMERLVQRVDRLERGTCLNGLQLAEELNIPVRVVKAVLELYTARGLGFMSRELGTVTYRTRV